MELSSSVGEEPLPIFQPFVGSSCWQGGREENQDEVYWEDTFQAHTLVDLLRKSNVEDLKRMCLFEGTLGASPAPPSIAVSAVFDGHGPLGSLAACLSKEQLPQLLRSNAPPLCFGETIPGSIGHSDVSQDEEQIRGAICTAISSTQEALLTQADTVDPTKKEYGTTAVIAVLWGGNQLTVANGSY